MTKLTDEQIAELERLEREATPAPWENRGRVGPATWICASAEVAMMYGGQTNPRGPENASLVVRIRNVLPSLLSEVRSHRAGENSATATDPGPNEIAGSPPPAECAHYWGDPALRCLLTDGHEGPHAWPEEAIARAREEGRQEGERDTLLAYRYGDGCRCAGGPFVRERPHSDKCRQWIAAMDRHGLLASRGTGGSK